MKKFIMTKEKIRNRKILLIKRLFLLLMVFSICFSSFAARIFDNVTVVNAASASSVTEEELFMLLPSYLINASLDDYYGKCTDYCLEAMDTVSDTDVLAAAYLEGLKSGANYLAKEGASLLGVTSSNFDSENKKIAGELLKEYFSVEENYIQDAESLVENYKYITKAYKGFSNSIIEEFKKANKQRKYITYTDEDIDEMFADVKLTGKILDRFGNAQEGLDVFIAIVEMNQLELESIDRLISITKVDSALMEGLLEIRADITDDLAGYLVRNYLNDKALEKIAKKVGQLTTGQISSGATMIVNLLVDVGVSIYSNFKPTVKDILYATLLQSYTSTADSAVMQLQLKFINHEGTAYDIETYRVAYNFYVSSLKLWMKKCEGLLKNSNATLKNKLNIYGESLGNEISYDIMGQLSRQKF